MLGPANSDLYGDASIMSVGMGHRWRERIGRLAVALGAIGVALLLPAVPAWAGVVNIFDAAHVLDATRVQNAAATLPEPVSIYTTIKDAEDNAAFDRQTQSHVTTSKIIVIAVNTQSHHLAIRTGAQSGVAQNDAVAATQAFVTNFMDTRDYTSATIAALDSMRAAIERAVANNAGQSRRATSSSTSWVSSLLCLGVVAVVVVAGAVLVINRRNRRATPAPPGLGGGYPGGAYPAGGPGYYGPPQQPAGVNPWVAGGVGALGGGLLGYELGRMEGQGEGFDREQIYNDPGADQGWGGGGGADADFGGGGGDFGGGAGDSF
jgi:hypothetical protein